MPNQAVAVSQEITSSAAAQVNGTPIRVAGFPFSVHIDGPDTLARISVSNDKHNWVLDTGTLGDSLTAVTSRPMWMRPEVAVDAGGPQVFSFKVLIYKEE